MPLVRLVVLTALWICRPVVQISDTPKCGFVDDRPFSLSSFTEKVANRFQACSLQCESSGLSQTPEYHFRRPPVREAVLFGRGDTEHSTAMSSQVQQLV